MTRSNEPSWPVRIGLLMLPLALVAVVVGLRQPAPPTARVLASIGADSYELTVAQTEAEQLRGLQGSPEPGRNEGMLFAFDPPRPVTMVIKTLAYPVDVVFVGADQRVVRTVSIQPRPQGIQSAPSGVDVRYAIEVRKGTLADGSIVPGNEFRLRTE